MTTYNRNARCVLRYRLRRLRCIANQLLAVRE